NACRRGRDLEAGDDVRELEPGDQLRLAERQGRRLQTHPQEPGMTPATRNLTIALAAAAALAGCAKEEKTSYGDARGIETVTNQCGSTALQLIAEARARSMQQAPAIASGNLPI